MAELKPGGKILIMVFVVALAGAGLYNVSPGVRDFVDTTLIPAKKGPGTIDPAALRAIRDGQAPPDQGGPAPTAQPAAGGEVPKGITTVDSFKYVGRQSVRDVAAVSNYTFNDKTVVFPINVWGGWAPIIMANGGFKPSEDSVFFKKFGFKVDLRLIDDPDAARAAYASGASHVLWGTLDMIALFAEGLSKDPRLTPRVPMQIDWSNGGDGIVARAHITTVNDLRGKNIVLAQNSPSHYYILSVLTEAGIQASEVNFKFTSTAFEAARAFVETASLDACVSWAPDIYKITDQGGVKGAHLLSTTGDANQLIADVFAVRSDFYRDHPAIVKGLVEGIFIGMEMAMKDKGKAADLMAVGFSLSSADCASMMNDAHVTNFAENVKFFTDPNFGANFERTWQSASYVYRAYGSIGTPVRSDEVKDASIIQTLQKEGKFAQQQDTYIKPVTAKAAQSFKNLEVNPILTKSIIILFPPNGAGLDEAYDAQIPSMIEDVGKLSEKFAGARIVIEGNTDTSRKMEVQRQGARIFQEFSRDVQKLSEARASSVKDAVLKKFPNIQRERLTVIGNGWDNPVDLVDHKRNRRVEVKVFSMEQAE